tara:strand:+ start:216 stop:461 length:246 start_codon:yes stop_codon:yes gene_type:complete
MKITRRQLRHIISEEVSRALEEQGCADTDDGCVKQSNGGDEYGPEGSWYILNNKKGGVWKKGFESKQSAKDSLSAMHSRGG